MSNDRKTSTVIDDAPPIAMREHSLSFDYERYAKHLDHSDLSDAQKRDMLEALWHIVVGFVELGFGDHPIQQACGKVLEIGADGAVELLECEHNQALKTKEEANASPERQV